MNMRAAYPEQRMLNLHMICYELAKQKKAMQCSPYVVSYVDDVYVSWLAAGTRSDEKSKEKGVEDGLLGLLVIALCSWS